MATIQDSCHNYDFLANGLCTVFSLAKISHDLKISFFSLCKVSHLKALIFSLVYILIAFIFEPGHEKMCLMSYANNKEADQPAHPRSQISAFVVRCLDSVMSLVSVTKISSLLLTSVAEQASLSLTCSETPEDTFSHDGAHLN